MTKLLDTHVTFDEDHHHGKQDTLVMKHEQIIPAQFLDDCIEKRNESGKHRERELMLAAEIPVVIVEKWLREGYDVFKEPVRKSLQRLRDQGLDYCITTNKRV